MPHTAHSTGLPALDTLLHGVHPGDNFVWEVEDVAHYARFIAPFVRHARAQGIQIVYISFAAHPPLLEEDDGITVYTHNPKIGFEKCVSDTIDIIERTCDSSWYVFDSLTGLAEVWYSDRMLANFFLVICPYVLQTGALAYFSLKSRTHSNHATDTIYTTAQVIVDVYEHNDRLYIQPQKVDRRDYAHVYMLHEWREDTFTPIHNSATITDIITGKAQPLMNFTIQRHGAWIHAFHEAQAVYTAVQRGEKNADALMPHFERLLRMLITREKAFIVLAREFFTYEELLAIMQRLIGSGLIGGKARGMLLAHHIVRDADPEIAALLETHDSFYIGSDVFYTYIIQNDCWWLRRKTGTIEDILARAASARERIMSGVFLDYIEKQFAEMLDYFGQSPIIVRSSSLLEDSYGNAFSGKYESVFLANQGTPSERLSGFLDAVRTVYASTMSEEALLYRVHHGLLYEDEQMALLVQRVSGSMYARTFFPPVAGVGVSYNPYVWSRSIDPHAGMLRLVFGLGTHAVDRVEDDYTRIVALNAPLDRPAGSADEARKYTQHTLDVLDLNENALVTRTVRAIFHTLPAHVRNLLATREQGSHASSLDPLITQTTPWRLSFQHLFTETSFVTAMQHILERLHTAYRCPVDIEFTVNFPAEGGFRINIVQCRPFQVRILGSGELGRIPDNIAPDAIVFDTVGPIVGHSLAAPIDRIIYVIPAAYARLKEQDRYAVARLIGRITHVDEAQPPQTVMLLGPGRWGTSTPAMGVPVSFKEINTVSVIGELALMHEGLVPDVSLGTHFFNDLVEMNMLYLAVFPEQKNNTLNEKAILTHENSLPHLLPAEAAWQHVVHVADFSRRADTQRLHLYVDSLRQHAICYKDV